MSQDSLRVHDKINVSICCNNRKTFKNWDEKNKPQELYGKTMGSSDLLQYMVRFIKHGEKVQKKLETSKQFEGFI